MELFYRTVVDVFEENGSVIARVRAGNVLKRISLAFVAEAEPGDTLLVCDGVAISRVEDKEEEQFVLGGSK